MRQVDGVATVRSLSGFVKSMTQSFAETFARWRMLPESRAQIAQGVGYATRLGNEFMNSRCTAMPINVYTVDHQADDHRAHRRPDPRVQGGRAATPTRIQFRLASGNVGVMAATNEAVHAADKWVNLALFISVGILCLMTFRSLAADAVRHPPARTRHGAVQRAHGDAGHRPQGEHAAGRRPGRGRGRRLRHLPVRAHQARDAGRRAVARATRTSRRSSSAARRRCSPPSR